MAYKIEVTDDCIKCGLCASVCDNFEMGDDKAHPVNEEIDDIGCNQEAADQCPQSCIHITKS